MLLKKQKKMKIHFSDKLLLTISYLFLILLSIICLFPFLLVISASFTDEYTLLWNGYQLFPKKLSLQAYRLLFQTSQVSNAYMVTVFITFTGTILSMLMTSSMAYPLSVRNFRIRNKIAFFVYFTMLFSGGMVAHYLLISKYLNMRNNIWVMIIPSLINPWNMFLLRNFFSQLPESLSESAKIDGANDITILFKIILPISLPGIATISLFYALGYWNEWYKAMLYIDKEQLFPLQYLIMKILRNMNFANTIAGNVGMTVNIPTYTVRMATVVVTIGPIIFLYPFLQKYFVKGLTVGGIKG
jgi:multiple sugar transport system permease protein/putative aldouronate transport system permease protein